MKRLIELKILRHIRGTGDASGRWVTARNVSKTLLTFIN